MNYVRSVNAEGALNEIVRTFQLGRRSGLACSSDGLFLSGVALLTKGPLGFEPRDARDVRVLMAAAYGRELDIPIIEKGLVAVSEALNRGDDAGAMIVALHLRMPDLDAVGLERLASAEAALAKYSADQPRDWHGRWTADGGSGPPGGGSASHSPRAAHDWGGPSHPTGGHLILTQADDGGDEGDPPSDSKPDTDPDEPTREKPPREWDRPDGTRVPTLRDGTEWPDATPPAVIYILSRGGVPGSPPSMVIYVPVDGKGPSLVGESDSTEFEQPPGYDRVVLHGIPQVTRSGGSETGHANASVEAALEMAATNRYSDIFFNRAFQTVTNGQVQSPLRPDVLGLLRPEYQSEYTLKPFEVLSPGQTTESREEQFRDLPGVELPLAARRYKILKYLLALFGKHWKG